MERPVEGLKKGRKRAKERRRQLVERPAQGIRKSLEEGLVRLGGRMWIGLQKG